MNKNNKNTKIKKFIFFLILFYFLIPSISLTFGVWAQEEGSLEVVYPEIPGGIDAPTAAKIYLPHYIRYIYNFAVAIGGIIAFLVLIYGGFRFLTSAGNPSTAADARSQIIAGFIGLIIILGSYVLLHEINPDLVSMRLPKISAAAKSGIILYGDGNCADLGQDAAIPELVMVKDVLYMALRGSGSVILKEEKDNQEYPLSFFTFHSSDTLKIELFTDEGCRQKAETLTNFEKNNCYAMPNNIKCIKFVWWKPGIWVFNKLDKRVDENGIPPDPLNLPNGWQEGRDYMVFQTTQENIPSAFSNNIRAIALVPDKVLDLHYGVILHNLAGQTFMQNKGYSQIILPGNTLCKTDATSSVTRCDLTSSETFENLANIASITLFNLPKEEVSAPPWTVTICRQDRCENYQPEGSKEDEYFDVQLDLRPGNELKDITSQVGGETKAYNASKNIVFAKNLRNNNQPGDLKWLDINESINNGGKDSGVSGVKIETGAPYLVLLYHLYNNDEKYNPVNRGKNSVVVMNRSNTSLRTMKKDDLVGTIVVIRVYR